MAVVASAPAVFIEDHDYPSKITQSSLVGHTYIHSPIYPVVHELASAKSTLTKSSQVVNHGGTAVVHAPVYTHVPVVHELSSAKSTVTKSSQVVNHGGTTVVHAPVYTHVPVVHEHVPVVHELSSAKSTVTKSSQVVNHGGTTVLHAPDMTHYVPAVHEIGSAKSTVTKSSQVVNHGGTTVVHAPVFGHVMHHVYDYAPHSVVYSPQVYSSAKTGDSAISHHSSTVHETEPVVNHYPLYALYH